MSIRKFLLVVLCTTVFVSPAVGQAGHGGAVYHAFRLETGAGRTGAGAGVADWDFDGWIGTDENKLWLRSEGERENELTGQAEFWAMYSRNIGTFWDVQIGIRHDMQPYSQTFGVIGFEGLAPYFFETQIHLFVSQGGDLSARIRQENEFFITQKLIVQPYAEANLYAQDVPELEVGAGLSDAEFGLQTRYEFTRRFAPYFDVKYEIKFGQTSSIATSKGEDRQAFVGTVGIRWVF